MFKYRASSGERLIMLALCIGFGTILFGGAGFIGGLAVGLVMAWGMG